MKRPWRQLPFAGIWTFLVALFLPVQAQAITLLPPCTKKGDCGISDILIVLVNGAEFLLAISGAVALLFFVYAGFVLLASAGRPAEVEKGKLILRNALIGIAIIFLSGVIIRFTTEALTGGNGEIPTVGESCTNKNKKAGLYVSIPSGVDPNDSTKIIPAEVLCVAKETSTKIGAPCKVLNSILKVRSRTERFSCLDVSGDVKTCVRGLCSRQPAGIACCIPE